jgi:hypothetical protein
MTRRSRGLHRRSGEYKQSAHRTTGIVPQTFLAYRDINTHSRYEARLNSLMVLVVTRQPNPRDEKDRHAATDELGAVPLPRYSRAQLTGQGAEADETLLTGPWERRDIPCSISIRSQKSQGESPQIMLCVPTDARGVPVSRAINVR